MKKGITSTGFKFEVDEKIIESWEFLKLARKMQKDGTYLLDVGELLLGDKLEDLEKHLEKTGRVLSKDMDRELTEILDSCGENSKNSESSPV